MKIKLGLENLSVLDIAKYCSGRLICPDGFDIKIEYVCTDSREADEGRADR